MAEDEDIGGAEVDSAPVESVDPPVSAEPSAPVEAAPQQQEVWGAFRQLPQFQGQEDRAIAQRLYQAMQREEAASRALQQYQSIVPVAQEYLQYRPQFDEWRRMQAQQSQQPKQAPQPEKPEPGWWNPPQVKDSYKRYLTRDENGREIISPDAPLDARASLEEFQQYRADFAQKFLDNPEATLGPMVEKVAMERAAELVDQRFSRMKDENYVAGLEQQNKDWLYDQNGNVSAEGVAVQKYIQDAQGLGISGAQARWDYATKMVERDLLLATLRQAQSQRQPARLPAPQPQPQPPQPTAEQQNMEFLRQQAMRTASQRSATPTTARAPTKAMSFEERLMSAAQDEGLL